MFDWIKKRVLVASNNAMKDDIERFIVSLKGADDEEIATMLVVANTLRLNLLRDGKIPPAALDINIPRNRNLDIKCSMCPILLVRIIKQFQKIDQPSDALGVMIWLHSVRALNVPEIRLLGRQMWQELGRGFPYAHEYLEEIRILSPNPLPSGIDDEIWFIPRGLEPKA